MIAQLFPECSRPLIGMLHCPALPGAPGYNGNLAEVRRLVVHDAKTLLDNGADGLMLENFFDAPFYPDRVPPETVAHLTRVACEVRERSGHPLGINVLRNDGRAALGIAVAVGAEFIRVNVLTGARVADQGIIQGTAHDLLRDRTAFNARHICILADIDVKHSAALGAARPVSEEVADLAQRGGADGLIVSGGGTGKEPSLDQLAQVTRAADDVPVFLGSGVTPDNVRRYADHAAGFIVGTSLKVDGAVRQPISAERVAALRAAVDDLPPR